MSVPALRRARTRDVALALLLVGGIVFAGGKVAIDQTNTVEFCISCHEMKDNNFEEYKDTIHAKNRTGVKAICSDCHVAHFSQQHGYSTGGIFTPLGPNGPYDRLLRNDEVELCLSCHNGTSFAPDVFGANGGAAGLRQAGGLNAAPGHGVSNDAGYDEINGHTIFSMATPPGGATSAYVPTAPNGLWCGSCHMVHGGPTYRNLSRRGIFAGDTANTDTSVSPVGVGKLLHAPRSHTAT